MRREEKVRNCLQDHGRVTGLGHMVGSRDSAKGPLEEGGCDIKVRPVSRAVCLSPASANCVGASAELD